MKSRQPQRTHNRQNTDTHSIEMDYCARSIVFASRELVVHSGKSNGVVCANIKRHWFASERNNRNDPSL